MMNGTPDGPYRLDAAVMAEDAEINATRRYNFQAALDEQQRNKGRDAALAAHATRRRRQLESEQFVMLKHMAKVARGYIDGRVSLAQLDDELTRFEAEATLLGLDMGGGS